MLNNKLKAFKGLTRHDRHEVAPDQKRKRRQHRLERLRVPWADPEEPTTSLDHSPYRRTGGRMDGPLNALKVFI